MRQVSVLPMAGKHVEGNVKSKSQIHSGLALSYIINLEAEVTGGCEPSVVCAGN